MSPRGGTQPRAGTLSAMKPFLAAVLLLASGCTIIGHERVDGWPHLQIVEHHVPHHAMRERCAKYAPPMMSPEACAEFYFAEGECHLWFSADFPPTREIVAHERLHCRGFEHVGENAMAGFLASWRASLPASVGASAADPGATAKSGGF